MSELHGSKCQEMHFLVFLFSKNFPGEHAPGPPRNDGLKPMVWVLQTHNCLLFTKLRLLKNLYTALEEGAGGGGGEKLTCSSGYLLCKVKTLNTRLILME